MSEPVIIVTAAGKGIGGAIARLLSERGYRLALMSDGGGAENLADELGAIARNGSVTRPDDLGFLVAATLETFGRIDGVVNNTGHPPKGELLEISRDHWHQGLDMVLLNVTSMASLVTPHLINAGGGSIVNISTFSAFEPSPDFPVSSVLRAALGSYTKLFAREFMSSGVRMNNVLPGFMDSYPVSETHLAQIPAGRYGKVAELAEVVEFLLSDRASYVTGQNLAVDGGLTRSV